MNESDPVSDSESTQPVGEAKPRKVVLIYDGPEKRPWVTAPFFLWTPLFLFVVALMLYFFFPDAMNDAIKKGYAAYETYVAPLFPQKPAPETPSPVVAKAAVFVPPPAPVQTYTVTEIKGAVQAHLIEIHYADADSQFDWTKLSYVDPSDLEYALFIKATGRKEAYCLGTVALNMAKHDMLVTSRLVGW